MGFEIDVTPQFLEGKMFLPPKVLRRLEDIRTDFAKGNEYAMFLHAEVDLDSLEIWVDEDIYDIPNQKVSPGTVEIEDSTFEIDEETGYGKKPLERTLNCVVHRHPNGVDSFSSTDNNYINIVNPISFLYQEGYYVPKARINVPWGDKILPLYVTPYIILENDEYIRLDSRHYSYASHHSGGFGWGSYQSDYGFWDETKQQYISRQKWDYEAGKMVPNPEYPKLRAEYEARMKKAEENRPKTDGEKIKEACEAAEKDIDLELCKERIQTFGFDYFRRTGMIDESDFEDSEIQTFLCRRRQRKKDKKHNGKNRDRGFKNSADFSHVFTGGGAKPKPQYTQPKVIEFDADHEIEDHTLGVDEEMDLAYQRLISGEEI